MDLPANQVSCQFFWHVDLVFTNAFKSILVSFFLPCDKMKSSISFRPSAELLIHVTQHLDFCHSSKFKCFVRKYEREGELRFVKIIHRTSLLTKEHIKVQREQHLIMHEDLRLWWEINNEFLLSRGTKNRGTCLKEKDFCCFDKRHRNEEYLSKRECTFAHLFLTWQNNPKQCRRYGTTGESHF